MLTDTVKALLLGLVQGLTEFLPVSSSGHLALAAHYLGITDSQLGLTLWLHGATLLAVVWVYRAELWRMARGDRALILLVLAGFLPTAVIGLLVRPYVHEAFESTAVVGTCFLVTAAALALGEWTLARCTSPRPQMSLRTAFLVGLAQSLALLPGISRSGITIAAALLLGTARPVAAYYSFLVAIPVIGGAFVFELPQFYAHSTAALRPLPLAVGFLAAFLSGFWALRWLLRLVPARSLLPFAVYCALVGTATLAAVLLGS